MTESISSGALCVTAQIKLDEEKSKTCRFWPSILAQFAQAGKRHNEA
jgi:hypothetical protein